MTTTATTPTVPLDLAAAAAGLAETWSPRVAGKINDIVVKVARFEGDFVWHNHPDTDEAFLCLRGELTIDLRDGHADQERAITLTPGEFYVIERGIFHCPHSTTGASVALFEAAGTINTGQVDSALTAPVDKPIGA